MGSAYFDAHSLWQTSGRLFRSLNEDLRFDTCIVGAGIAGLTTAYELLAQGQTVAVLDRERLGLGETGLTSAHLSNALDDGYVALQRMHGTEGARLAAESHTFAIDQIERLVKLENIDCDFERLPGYLFLGESRSLSDLQAELEAAKESGLHRVKMIEKAPTRLFDTGPCLVYPDQATFHPVRYLEGLAEAVIRMGGRIFTHTDVTEVQGGPETFVKTRAGHKIECDAVVVATNVPFNSGMTIHSKNAPYRSYIIGVLLPPEKKDRALFWDNSDPYHYLNFVKDPINSEDILLVGGGDHRTGQDLEPEHHFTELHAWVKRRLDFDTRVVTRWSGQIMEPVDGLAYIGHNPADSENIFIVTGDSGHGLTHGTLAGRLLRDLILGQENPWQKLYSPSRLHFRSLSNFAKEATQSTVPYSDWLTESNVDSPEQIARGEGAVLRSGLKKIAVFKDDGGRMHTCSAVCTHLGGVVRWNSAEKTWDCPCHGSRFDRFGRVVNGPAHEDLKPLEDLIEPQAENLPLQT